MNNAAQIEKELQEIRNMLDQKATKKDVEDLKAMIEALRQEMTKLHEESITLIIEKDKESKGAIADIRGQVNGLETKTSFISKSLTDLTTRVEKHIKDHHQVNNGNPLASASKIEDSEFQDLKQSCDSMKKDLYELQKELTLLHELQKRVHHLTVVMETKLDKEEFEKFKNAFDLNQLLSGLTKRFADKNEMIKWLRKLEKRIMMLEESVSKETNMIEMGEGAMFAKKPLGGWSCASCTKDLINIEGRRVPYNPWQRLPTRDPAERIAKVFYFSQQKRSDMDFQECWLC